MSTHSIGGFFRSALGFFLLTFYNVLFLLNGFLLDDAFHFSLCKRQSELALLVLKFAHLAPSPLTSPYPKHTQDTNTILLLLFTGAAAPTVALFEGSVLITS